jgi:hypothetical protein
LVVNVSGVDYARALWLDLASRRSGRLLGLAVTVASVLVYMRPVFLVGTGHRTGIL